MRGIILTMMAFLAMTSLGLAAVSVDFVPDQYYQTGTDPVDDGYKSFIVQATGENINCFTDFTFTGSRAGGDVYQVFNGTDDEDDITPWINDTFWPTPGDPMDTYVIFGSKRLPDGGNPRSSFETVETIDSPAPYLRGMGTLTNDADGHFDGYVRLGDGIDYTPGTTETVDLFHVVIPDGSYVTLDIKLFTADLNPATGFYDVINEHNLSVQVNCPLDGDANEDGQVSAGDFSLLLSNWQQSGGWGEGDFNGDGSISAGDFSLLLANWQGQADWYPLAESGGGEGSSVPEPGTLALLVLGSLCFAGYRLRK